VNEGVECVMEEAVVFGESGIGELVLDLEVYNCMFMHIGS
jgi:hypothetical protein